MTEEIVILRRHIRKAHPNLLGLGWDTWIAFSPLPEDGLSGVPDNVLHAIHEASHRGLWKEHQPDDWLTRKWAEEEAPT